VGSQAARLSVCPERLSMKKQTKKAFFFEKKNQKTFAYWYPTASASRLNFRKFFASFFQKRSACFPLSP
jgi:hypothetical protein